MGGIRKLRKIQLGKETTAGTAVMATTIWRGVASMPEDQRQVVFPTEDVGFLSGTDRSYIPVYDAVLAMADTEATFEQLPYILEAGIMSVVTGTANTGGSGYTYTYNFPTTAQRTQKTFTIEAGDDNAAEEMEHSYVEDFAISGAPKSAIMVSANWRGRQLSVSSFTTTATLPTVEEILFNASKLYIDTAGANWGTTQKSQTMLGFNLNVRTGFIPKYTGDGNLYFSYTVQTEPEITLDVTFEHDGTATTEKAAYRAQTVRKIRVLAEGSTFTTAGTYAKKTMIIDLVGKWQSFAAIDEIDGNDVVTGTFAGKYNATAASAGRVIIANLNSSLA